MVRDFVLCFGKWLIWGFVIHSYYVTCSDGLGNKNADDFVITFSIALPAPEPEPEPLPFQTIIAINEIAWMGSEVSTNNEWMELFNLTDQTVDLSGWQLTSADGTPAILLSTSISAHDFYLLERTDDDSVPGVSADQIYTGALGNSGEHMYLYDGSGNIADEVDCMADWFAGDNNTKQTMQRKDPLSSGNDANNWQTSQDSGGTPRS